MDRRKIAAWVGLITALVGGIGIIVLLTSSPKRRTLTISEPPVPHVDEAAARQELDELVAGYRKAGEPIAIEDFRAKPVEKAQNAAVPLHEAARIVNAFEQKNPNSKFFDGHLSIRMSAADWKPLEETLPQFAPVLAKVDEAETRPGVDWHVKMDSPSVSVLLPHLNELRQMADVLRIASLVAHHQGRDDEAVRRASQIVMLAKASERKPFLITHLVTLGILRVACSDVADVVPTLKIGSAPGDATPEQVRALIAQLNDDAWLRDGLRDAFFAERMSVVDTARCLTTGKLKMSDLEAMTATSRPTTPAPPAGTVFADACVILRNVTQIIDAAKSERLSEFRSKAPKARPTLGLPVMKNLTITGDGFAVTHYTAVSRLRLASAALAARWWAADHAGALPASLDALVPAYLPAVPADPMAAAPATISYKTTPRPAVFGASPPNAKDKAIINLTAAD